MALQALAPLVQGMSPSEAGCALQLMLWVDAGHEVPYTDPDACCALTQATTAPDRSATFRVVDKLFTPMSENGESATDERYARYAEGPETRYARYAGLVTHEKLDGETREDASESLNQARIAPVSNAVRQATARRKRQALRQLLTSKGHEATSRMSLQELEDMCRHMSVDIPREYLQEYVDPSCVTKVSSRAPVCVLIPLNKNTEYINNTVLNTQSRYLSQAREAAEAMRSNGCPDANEHHPLLTALVASGATLGELRLAALEASAVRKGFRYALGIAGNRRRDAQAAALAPQAVQAPPTPEELAFDRMLDEALEERANRLSHLDQKPPAS